MPGGRGRRWFGCEQLGSERGLPAAGRFPRSVRLLLGPGTRGLFILLEGDRTVAKNNCLHRLISQQGGTSPFLTFLGCDTGHFGDSQSR